ncbi:Uncharacterized protein pbN1_24540 [Aromatoleum bremense]|nr:Uncharacterized protein pbN1_24540 [Aromatoleum bremense]
MRPRRRDDPDSIFARPRSPPDDAARPVHTLDAAVRGIIADFSTR